MENSFLNILMLVALGHFVNVDAQGPDGVCVPEVRVQKKHAFNDFRKCLLRLPCTVRYCEEIPTIRWVRLDDTDRGIPVRKTDQITVTQERLTADKKEIILYLNFKHISKHDNGLYRCTVNVSDFLIESHNINVSVSDTVPVTPSGTSPPLTVSNRAAWKPYSLICSGVFGLVTIMLLISLLSLHTCSRKPVKHTTQFSTVVFTLAETSPTIQQHTDDH